MNGQRFHQQKRVEMKTEQCERSLKVTRLIATVDCANDLLKI